MPKVLEEKLRREASKHSNWSEERKNAYIYGTMRNTGWTPSTQKRKAYKRLIDNRMKSFGDIDDDKKIIRVNPKKGDLVNTILHEELHSNHQDKPEKWINKKAKETESKMGINEQVELLKKYKKLRKKIK